MPRLTLDLVSCASFYVEARMFDAKEITFHIDNLTLLSLSHNGEHIKAVMSENEKKLV